MSLTQADESDLFLRFSRRSLTAALFAIVLLGATFVITLLWPAGVLAQTVTHMPWLLPALLFAVLLLLRVPLKGRRWDPEAPAVRAILEDEFRRANLARAERAALVVVLVAQFPLALALLRMPAAHATLVMAAVTIVLGMACLIAAFLAFDRG